MKRSRRWLFRIIVFLPVILVLFSAELLLRWKRDAWLASYVENDERLQAQTAIHRKSTDPVLIYEMIPGSETVRDGVSIKVNAAGFRDHEFPDDPEGKRIVVLGDSVAFGWSVPMEQAFPQLLEEKLEERAVVYNLAVSGYSTAQEVRLLEARGLGFKPDAVILTYVLNDPDVRDGGLSRYFEASSRIETIHLVRNFIRKFREKDDDGKGGGVEYHRRIHETHADEIRGHFENLGRISRSGVTIVVAVMPVFRFGPKRGYPWNDVHARLEALCVDNGLEFIDLYECFDGKPSWRFSLDAWHPNAVGHAVIAEKLCTYVNTCLWD